MPFPARVPNKAKTLGRVDFDIEQFRILMEQKGLDANWIKTTICPCSMPSSDAGMDLFAVGDITENLDHDPACTTCGGHGFIRYDEEQIKIMFTSNSAANQINDYGTSFESGAGVTLLPEHLPSFGDKFSLLNSAIQRSEKLTMSASGLVELGYQAVTRTLDLATGPEERNILAVFINDANGTNSFQLQERSYSYDATTNRIRFLEGLPGINRPVEGHEFTVVYYTNPVFNVISHPYVIRDTMTFRKGVEKMQSMPVRCLVALENL